MGSWNIQLTLVVLCSRESGFWMIHGALMSLLHERALASWFWAIQRSSASSLYGTRCWLIIRYGTTPIIFRFIWKLVTDLWCGMHVPNRNCLVSGSSLLFKSVQVSSFQYLSLQDTEMYEGLSLALDTDLGYGFNFLDLWDTWIIWRSMPRMCLRHVLPEARWHVPALICWKFNHTEALICRWRFRGVRFRVLGLGCELWRRYTM